MYYFPPLAIIVFLEFTIQKKYLFLIASISQAIAESPEVISDALLRNILVKIFILLIITAI